MQNLNPTLWRTCRVLAGKTRLRLLRQIHDRPGQSVAELAAAVGIGRSDASQELRRLQSRGLLRAARTGARLVYRLEADPQVPSAGVLLKALTAACISFPPERDGEIATLATGLAYPRRIALAQALMKTPRTATDLQVAVALPMFAVHAHLRVLKNSGWVHPEGRQIRFDPPAHPLAKALTKLLSAE